MRIEDSIRQTVVFIGYPTDQPGKGGIDCIGTAFLLRHQGFPYLITARHVAEFVGEHPFLLRVNRVIGGADNLFIDNATWHYDPDPSVDVAVLPILGLLKENDHYFRFIDDERRAGGRTKLGNTGSASVIFATQSDFSGFYRAVSKTCLPFTLEQSRVPYTVETRSLFRSKIGATRQAKKSFLQKLT